MATSLGDAALDQILAAAGLHLTDAQKAELAQQQQALAAMKARVRQPRGRMAEPAHVYGFAPEDLA
jgi:hypothetical protein